MSSFSRSGFPSRRPLPTISESPTSSSALNPSTPSSSTSTTNSFRSKSTGSIPKLAQTRSSSLGPPLKAAARTSKTSQKHVNLPTEAQEQPLPSILETPDINIELVADEIIEDAAVRVRDENADPEEEDSRATRKKSRMRGGREEVDIEDGIWKRTIGEQMPPDQRDEAGYQRLTAYYCCEEFNMGLLSGFLKREHAVSPRLYDDAIYALYHLPLLPGYQPNINIRSCITDKSAQAKLVLSLITEAEEAGYHDAYFPSNNQNNMGSNSGASTPVKRDGFIETAFPAATSFTTLLANKALKRNAANANNLNHNSDQDQPRAHPSPSRNKRRLPRAHIAQRRLLGVEDRPVAEAIFFSYGVVVFFGFSQRNELDVLDDLVKQGIMVKEKRKGEKKNYEIERFHFEYDPAATTPRIYNDFFTFKSPSHLLKLAIAHAIAQSTVLAVHETASSDLLSSPLTLSIPLQLATSGIIKMRRRVALRLTGQLFQMRQNVNLSSNVLDVPELFWSEASLKGLYDAVREYLEIDQRVQALNEKLAGVGDLLDVIHDHLNNDAMERITLIIIWLIVVACLVELGELLARWILAASASARLQSQIVANRDAILRILEETDI